jgi:hypothetical protein
LGSIGRHGCLVIQFLRQINEVLKGVRVSHGTGIGGFLDRLAEEDAPDGDFHFFAAEGVGNLVNGEDFVGDVTGGDVLAYFLLDTADQGLI